MHSTNKLLAMLKWKIIELVNQFHVMFLLLINDKECPIMEVCCIIEFNIHHL